MNDLIWYLPSDLKFFKSQTKNCLIAMGKNTFNSLPRILPNRLHIILSSSSSFNKDLEDSIVIDNKDEFINYCKTRAKSDDIYIIGGASIYSMFIDIADELILTHIDSTSKADAFFPTFDKNDFTFEILGTNFENEINFSHIRYVRKNI